jgi:hypothetical protein
MLLENNLSYQIYNTAQLIFKCLLRRYLTPDAFQKALQKNAGWLEGDKEKWKIIY